LKFILLILALLPIAAVADLPKTFSTAKKVAAGIYADHQTSFYCGCDYSKVGKKLVPDHKSCGYSPRKEVKRSARIEWEHVVPAWAFGHQLQCWQEGGRKNCKKNNPQFKLMEADLMNLVPAVGEINGNRSNYSFAMLEGEPRVYGACDFEVDFKARKAEPAPEVRGDIARIYFYMQEKYGMHISKKQMQLFLAWDRQGPIDDWEREKLARISAIEAKE
tara:strand:+ start:152 stop:808 length:657 start_codon:yes stop_codon:yes gene_type:complete